MNKSWVCATLMLLASFMPAEAEAAASRPANVVTHMVRLQHADPVQVYQLLDGTGARVRFDDVLRVVVISGTPSDVASLEQTIKDLDAETQKSVASNIEVTV